MQSRKYPSLLICVLIFFSCKKDPVTRVVEFNSTTYATLGNYDASGKPSYLVARDSISPGMLAFIKTTLPEFEDLRKTHPELLTTSAIADITITRTTDVYITFVSQATGYTNTLAFYTYPSNQPPASTADIKTITCIFPTAGLYTPLHHGDKVNIGNFQPGISIGFVVLHEGWNVSTHTLDNKVVHFCTNDVLNPEVDPALKKHAVLINYPAENKVLIGVEDIDRTNPSCDNDFNDLLFFCTFNH